MFEPITKSSYFNVLTEISTLLNCKLNTRKQISTGNEYFVIVASSRKSLLTILTYFKCFPLFSSKYLDYKDWEQGANLILKNDHYTEKGTVKINDLRGNMN